MSNPLSDLTVIRTKVTEIVTPHGLRVALFVVIPGENAEGPHYCQVMMTTDGQTPDEMDRQFTQMVKEEAEAKKAKDREEHFAAVEQDLTDVEEDLKRGRGLL